MWGNKQPQIDTWLQEWNSAPYDCQENALPHNHGGRSDCIYVQSVLALHCPQNQSIISNGLIWIYTLFRMYLFLSRQAVIGLMHSKKLKHPNFEFDSEEVRYTHRFAPFACVSTPPMVPYSQYRVSFFKPLAKPKFLGYAGISLSVHLYARPSVFKI